jgi:hypothetical protein
VISVITFQSWQTDDGDSCHQHIFRFQTRYTALTCHRGQAAAQLWSQIFIQMLGIMTSLIITSHFKERPFVLLHSQAIFSVSQQPVQHLTMLQAQRYHRAENISHGDAILPELLSDNLYDVPEDSLVISESNKDDSMRERKIVHPKQTYSERQTSSVECDDSINI